MLNGRKAIISNVMANHVVKALGHEWGHNGGCEGDWCIDNEVMSSKVAACPNVQYGALINQSSGSWENQTENALPADP
ncbi:MAG: hypothetical protein IT365_07450 [Candidatus Hydrogenedentes bacterium]|nr:hypothetical protein [Candidatus Hydrogenedentota bacterium]